MKRARFDIYRREIPELLPLKHHSLKIAFIDNFYDGLCYGPYKNKETGKKYFYIVINKRNTLSSQIDYFMHEYAHALNLDEGGTDYQDDIKDHGPEWGVCYSKVYQAMLRVKIAHGFK